MQVVSPGDPARRVLTARGVQQPSDAQIQAESESLGLDRPAPVRYVSWLADAARGDFGSSWASGKPVTGELGKRLPATLILAALAMLMALSVSLLFGVMAAGFAGRWPDVAIRTLTVVASVVPSFLIGAVLLQVVVLRFGIFRVISDGSWRSAFLPAATLAIGAAAVWTRVLRAELIRASTALNDEVAWARGAGPLRRLIVHHVPNALVPVLTIVGTGAAALLAGAPIIETVYTWPGVGRFVVGAINARDVPVVQGFAMFSIGVFIVVNMIVDVVAVTIDPRMGVAETRAAPQ